MPNDMMRATTASLPLALSPERDASARAGAGDLPDSALDLLNHMRLLALECRCSARTPVQEACRALSADETVARAAYADLLVRSLTQIIGRTPVFHSPGASVVSADETWLMRLILAVADRDVDSSLFLIRSRVPRHMRDSLALLVGAVSRAFSIYDGAEAG